MAQAKKKTATKTAKKQPRPAQRKAASRTAKKQGNQQEKIHIYIITAMSMIAGILLCANAAMMMA